MPAQIAEVRSAVDISTIEERLEEYCLNAEIESVFFVNFTRFKYIDPKGKSIFTIAIDINFNPSLFGGVGIDTKKLSKIIEEVFSDITFDIKGKTKTQSLSVNLSNDLKNLLRQIGYIDHSQTTEEHYNRSSKLLDEIRGIRILSDKSVACSLSINSVAVAALLANFPIVIKRSKDGTTNTVLVRRKPGKIHIPNLKRKFIKFLDKKLQHETDNKQTPLRSKQVSKTDVKRLKSKTPSEQSFGSRRNLAESPTKRNENLQDYNSLVMPSLTRREPLALVETSIPRRVQEIQIVPNDSGVDLNNYASTKQNLAAYDFANPVKVEFSNEISEELISLLNEKYFSCEDKKGLLLSVKDWKTALKLKMHFSKRNIVSDI
ncbi:MAG: hypothetical protein KDD56_00800 [Bdellovibrionales bacterium]|nr:hypothetical protein [Bdellovibrionales bacterium]